MPPTIPLEQCMAQAREIKALKDEVALLRIAQARADGALADAATVQTGGLERGIRALTEERDGLKTTLEMWVAECGEGGPRPIKAEVEWLQQWVNDLQAGMYINCVYCGHRYGPDDKVPATMAQVLKDHIAQCPKHPMSAMKADVQALAEALSDSTRLLNTISPQDPDDEGGIDYQVKDNRAALSRDGVRREEGKR